MIHWVLLFPLASSPFSPLIFSFSFLLSPLLSFCLPCIYILPMLVANLLAYPESFLLFHLTDSLGWLFLEHGCTFYSDRHADDSISLLLWLLLFLLWLLLLLLLLYTHIHVNFIVSCTVTFTLPLSLHLINYAVALRLSAVCVFGSHGYVDV